MKSDDFFEVNPAAESVSSAVAKVVLVVCIIAAFILLIAGFIGLEDGGGIMLIGISVVCTVTGVVSWAFLKMIVNISRSLYNINNALRGDEAISRPTIPDKDDSENAPQPVVDNISTSKTKFAIGQLVIVKYDESQFRISDIDDRGGALKPRYYSKKFERYFFEDEIDDFDTYWKNKKSHNN